jgi:predicted nucleotidyltransferase
MNTDDVVGSVIDSLNQQGVPYMIVGSLATNFYCVPRSTQDADIVVQSRLAEVARQVSQGVSGMRFDPQLGFESVTATKKLVLSTQQHDFQIELFELSGDEHDQLRFSRRVQVEILGRTTWIATVEDMIVTKLRWSQHAGREKDIADVRNLIAVQQDRVDWPYVELWSERHGTRTLLDRLRSECTRD